MIYLIRRISRLKGAFEYSKSKIGFYTPKNVVPKTTATCKKRNTSKEKL